MNEQENTNKYIWPGLAPYQEKDKGLFYGRSGEISDLGRKIAASRLTVLFGPSGAGKTSLLQAGIFPKLREQNLLPILIRIDFPLPGEPMNPAAAQFEGALRQECESQGIIIHKSEIRWFADRKNRLSLWEWLRSFNLADPSGASWQPVFILDQFEEVFTLGRNIRVMESFLQQIGDAAENFLPEEIARLVNEEGVELPFDPVVQPYKIVIALREDYLAQLQGLRPVMPGVTVRRNHFPLGGLTGTMALEAVTGPAPAGMITSRVATEIIYFVANASEGGDSGERDTDVSLDHLEVEPAILSLVCQQLDLRRQAEGRQMITVEFVKQSRSEILEEFYGSAMQSVSPATRTFIEDHLLDAEGFRTSEPESSLLQSEVPTEDIRHLIDLRLLHRIEHYHRSHLELSHDVLVPVVKASRDSRLQHEESEKQLAQIAVLKKQHRRSLALAGSFALITFFALLAVFFAYKKQKEIVAVRRWAVSVFFTGKSQEWMQKNVDKAASFAQLACQFDSSSFVTSQFKKIIYDNTNPMSLATLKGHRNHVMYAEFSPDGKYVLTASEDSTIRLWDVYGSQVAVMNTQNRTFAFFSPDGQRFLTSTEDGTARIWDLKGSLVLNLKAHTGSIDFGLFSPDSQRFLTCSNDSTAKLWDLKGNLVADLKGHSGPVIHAAFSPDGLWIGTASRDSTVRRWDLKGKLLTRLKGHLGEVTSIAISPDGKRILTGSSDATAKLWNLQGNRITDFKGHRSTVIWVNFSPDGQRILTCGIDSTAKLWDLKGNLITDFKGHTLWIVSSVFSPDGESVLTCSYDNTARLWDLKGNLLAVLKHQGPVQWGAFSPDGQKIVTASHDHTAKIWEIKGNLVADFNDHHRVRPPTVLSPDGRQILTVSADSTAKLWDERGNLLVILKGHKGRVNRVYFSPDGQKMVTVSADRTARIWDMKGNQLAELKGHTGNVYRAYFSPDGQKIVTSAADSTARLWDIQGNLLAVLKGHGGEVIRSFFSPDGLKIVTASADSTAKIWDLSGNLLLNLRGHKGPLLLGQFSPDGEQILTASFNDPTPKIWDIKGNLIAELNGHTWGGFSWAEFSPDGKMILTGSFDRTARLWDLKGNQLTELTGHNSGVSFATFSLDGKFVATGGVDHTVKLWDIKGNPIADLKGHQDQIAVIYFSPDGERILTDSYDNTAKLWPGLKETINRLSQNRYRDKLSISDLATAPVRVSRDEFEKASANNIVEGTYKEYRQLIRQGKKK